MAHSADKYFFEIAVYRCSPATYIDEVDRATNKLLEENGVSEQSTPVAYGIAKDHVWETCGGPWRYNQVIGWVRLFVLSSQIRGELWSVKAKRITRNTKEKSFRHSGDGFELSFHDEDSSETIFGRVLAELERLADTPRFKRRHVDLEAFCNVGPCIDWRRLLGFSTQLDRPLRSDQG